ncbi:hypothetical protein OSTOST_17163 [Ostertagia ostertagi]
MYLTRVEGLAQTLRLSRFTASSHLIEAVTSPCLLADENFMALNSEVAPQHTYTELTYVTQSDYHYWHERDWFVDDRMLALLRHSAITYPSLIHTFFSPDHGPDTIVFPNGAFFDRTAHADDVSAASKPRLSEGRSAITNALYRYMLRKRDAEEAGDRYAKV